MVSHLHANDALSGRLRFAQKSVKFASVNNNYANIWKPIWRKVMHVISSSTFQDNAPVKFVRQTDVLTLEAAHLKLSRLLKLQLNVLQI